MSKIQSIMDALDERTVAQRVTIPLDEVRLEYHQGSTTVRDVAEFERATGGFLQLLYARRVAPGAHMPDFEAIGRAKRILETAYRHRRQTLQNAIADCLDGANGGVRAVLDTILEAVKAESIEHYVEDVFDRHVALNDWPQRVAIIEELKAHYGHLLSEAVRREPAERHAANYKELLRSMVHHIREMNADYRRV